MQELGLSATSEPSRAGHRVFQRAEVRTIGRLTRDVRLERCCDIAQPRTPEHLRRSPCRRDGISRVILLYPPSASGVAAAVNDLHGLGCCEQQPQTFAILNGFLRAQAKCSLISKLSKNHPPKPYTDLSLFGQYFDSDTQKNWTLRRILRRICRC